MVEKMYELKAKYEAEISRLQLKVEVLSELLDLVPQEETVELLEQSESEEVSEETETVDELENL